jgi:hypothetical protein
MYRHVISSSLYGCDIVQLDVLISVHHATVYPSCQYTQCWRSLSAHNQLILSTHARLPFIFEFRARKKRAGGSCWCQTCELCRWTSALGFWSYQRSERCLLSTNVCLDIFSHFSNTSTVSSQNIFGIEPGLFGDKVVIQLAACCGLRSVVASSNCRRSGV